MLSRVLVNGVLTVLGLAGAWTASRLRFRTHGLFAIAMLSVVPRDFLTVALVIDAENMFPDNWIYIHSPEVRVGRIQNFKNWSPYMVPDSSKTCLGLEYFVNEGDDLWRR